MRRRPSTSRPARAAAARTATRALRKAGLGRHQVRRQHYLYARRHGDVHDRGHEWRAVGRARHVDLRSIAGRRDPCCGRLCVAAGAASCGTVTGTAGQTSFGTTGAKIVAGAGNTLTFTAQVAFAPSLTVESAGQHGDRDRSGACGPRHRRRQRRTVRARRSRHHQDRRDDDSRAWPDGCLYDRRLECRAEQRRRRDGQ